MCLSAIFRPVWTIIDGLFTVMFFIKEQRPWLRLFIVSMALLHLYLIFMSSRKMWKVEKVEETSAGADDYVMM